MFAVRPAPFADPAGGCAPGSGLCDRSPRVDGDEPFDAAIDEPTPYAHVPVVQVDGGIAMARDEPDGLTEPGERLTLHRAHDPVLVAPVLERELPPPAWIVDARQPRVDRVALVPRVHDRTVCPDAHDLRQHEQRVLERRMCDVGFVVGVVAVHEEVAAGLSCPLVPAPVTSGQDRPARSSASRVACAATTAAA